MILFEENPEIKGFEDLAKSFELKTNSPNPYIVADIIYDIKSLVVNCYSKKTLEETEIKKRADLFCQTMAAFYGLRWEKIIENRYDMMFSEDYQNSPKAVPINLYKEIKDELIPFHQVIFRKSKKSKIG